MKKSFLILIAGMSLSARAQEPLKAATRVGKPATPPLTLTLDGSSSICEKASTCSTTGATKFIYNVTGFPDKSTNIIVNGWDLGSGIDRCSSSGAQIEVVFNNSGCPSNTNITALSGSYNDAKGTLCFFLNVSKSISLSVLGTTISQKNTWNITPKYYNQTYITYEINPVCGATSYQWNIPAGWTPQGSLTGTSIKVEPSLNTGGVISVDAYSSCGLKTSYSQTITRPKDQPVFTNTIHSQCIVSNPSQVFTINPVANAAQYLWSLPSGWSWTGGTAPNQLSASVNFNNVSQKSNVCVQTVYPDGATSNATCFEYTTFNAPAQVLYSSYEEEPGVSTNFIFLASGNDIIQTSTSAPTSSTVWQDRSNSFTFRVVAPRSYVFWVRTKNDCGPSTSERYYLDVRPAPGITARTNNFELKETHSNEITLFPNPSNGSMQLNYTLEKARQGDFQITDLLGKQVAYYKLTEGMNSLPIDATELKAGIYLYRVVVNGEVIKSDKLSIAH